MISARQVALVVLLTASIAAHAQSDDRTDIAPALRASVDAYRAGDLQTAEGLLRPLAAGNPDAEAWLGAVLLDRGLKAEGLRALQRAADAGSPEGEHRLALVFAEGLAGTPRNEARAFELFEKAANAGHVRAQIDLGILYFRGRGVERDLVQARAWLEKAAAKDDPYALYALGRAMEDSQGAALADPVRAADLYRRAAELGHPLAALRYGLALMDGIGVKKDGRTAQRWLLQADRDGVPEAALALADMTVRLPAKRDKAENDKLVELALMWYRTAADAGVASAQFKLANAYFAGRGVARDPAQALFWYGRAARQGLPEAQHALGIVLIGGLAGSRDPVEGYKWLILAEKGGDPDSPAVRQKADGELSAADRARAEVLARSFKPVSERPVTNTVPPLSPPTKP
jgi:TPR repeat protein